MLGKVGEAVFFKGEHFIDECDQCKKLSDQKQNLLSQGQCFLCFKIGHTVRDCTISQRKGCFYCGKQKHHNRAIFPINFPKEVINRKGKIEQHLRMIRHQRKILHRMLSYLLLQMFSL